MRITFAMMAGLVACAGPIGTDAPDTDTGVDEVGCAIAAPLGVLLEPDADGPDTQIHAASASDGVGAWVAWNVPDDAGQFDVRVARLGCDGGVEVGPLEVTDSDDNELDPAVAVAHDRVVVAWQSDRGVQPDNLDIRWRVLDLDGTPRGPVQELDAPGNQWMPSLAATPDGFVLAGSGGGGQVFEVFTQALDAEGQATGDRVDVDTDPGQGELWPSVAVDGSGGVHLAWEGDALGYAEVGGAPTTWPPPAAQPSVSAWDDQVWVGWSDPVGDVLLARPEGASVVLKGGGDKTHHTIAVAAGPEGGHAVWSTHVSGLDNRIKLGRFDADGVLIDTLDLGTDTAPPYPVNLTRIDEDTVFFAWQDGVNPAYRVRAGFFSL